MLSEMASASCWLSVVLVKWCMSLAFLAINLNHENLGLEDVR